MLQSEVNKLLNAEQIIYFQQLVRNIPVTDNVLEYAVRLVAKTRPWRRNYAAPQVKRLLNPGCMAPRIAVPDIIKCKMPCRYQWKILSGH